MKLNQQQNEQLGALLASGVCVMVGEFIGGKPETINYVAKSGANTGKAASFSRVSCVVVVGSEGAVDAVKASIGVPDGQNPDKFASDTLKGLKRGSLVAMAVDSIEIDKGNKNLRVSKVIPLA